MDNGFDIEHPKTSGQTFSGFCYSIKSLFFVTLPVRKALETRISQPTHIRPDMERTLATEHTRLSCEGEEIQIRDLKGHGQSLGAIS